MGGSTSKEIEAADTASCWALLERLATSSQLRRAPRLREFLEYIAKRSLRDGCNHIHEHEIGVEVFGRPEAYDTSIDNIVRANATELRKRLEAYFGAEGAHEPVVLDIPRGSYVPVFKRRPATPEAPEPAVSAPPAFDLPSSVAEVRPLPPRRYPTLIWIAVTATLGAACAALWMQVQSTKKLLSPWRSEPAVAALWSQFVDTGRVTDVVVADQSFLLLQNLDKRSFTFDDYLNHGYLTQLQAQDLSPDMHTVMNLLASKTMGNMGEIRLAEHILALDPQGKSVQLYNAREYTSLLLARDNVILIGSSFSNPWQDLFAGRLNFVSEPDVDSIGPILNRAPQPGEPALYSSDNYRVGYCTVDYLPNPNHIGKVLLISGTSAEATEAGGDFLLSEDQLSSFQKKLHATTLPFFEVLLKSSQAIDTPFSTTIAAYRTYPGLQ
ncbi:MAG: hypothetical protein ACRD3N_03150 [Terracidiphilus sp.]